MSLKHSAVRHTRNRCENEVARALVYKRACSPPGFCQEVQFASVLWLTDASLKKTFMLALVVAQADSALCWEVKPAQLVLARH